MDSNHTNSNPYHSDTAISHCLKSLETLGIIARHTEDGTDRYYLAELKKAG